MFLSNIWLFLLLFLRKDSFAKIFNLANDPEDLITTSIINNFGIKHCIFIKDFNDTENLKKFSAQYITANIFNYNELYVYLAKGIFPDVKKMIVVDDKNLIRINQHFQTLQSIGLLHQIHHFTWLVFSEFHENLRDTLQNLLVPYNCQFIISFPINSSTYRLMEVYKAKNRTFYTELGVIQNKEITFTHNYLYSRRMDLNGTMLEMNVDDFLEFQWLKEIPRIKRQLEILDGIAKVMNLQYDHQAVNRSNDNRIVTYKDLYGIPMPFHSISFSTDFVGPIFKATINWYIKYPKSEERADYFIHPFHPYLWACILVYIALGGFCGALIKIILNVLAISERTSIPDLVFLGFDSFCNQIGCNEDLKRTSLRLLSITFRLAALYVIPSYSATITSFLTVKIMDIPFTNFEEFVKNGRYTLGFSDGSFLDDYLKESTDPTLRRIYDHYSWKHSEILPPEYHEKFCRGELAYTFLDNDIRDPYFKEYQNCEIFKIENPITYFFWGAFLGTNSPFKEVFNYNLMRFYTSGIMNKLQKITEEDSSMIASKQDDGFQPMKIKQMFHVFCIVEIGIILAVIIVIFEFRAKRVRIVKTRKRIARVGWITHRVKVLGHF